MSSSAIYNYVVTAQKPTSVNMAITGNFTSPTDVNLVLSKNTRIEIHLLTPDGIKPLHDVPIYGRIARMEFFRPKVCTKDLLLVTTQAYKFMIIEYDAATGELVTKARGDLQDRIGRPADAGQIVCVDPLCRMTAHHLYDGLLKIVPMGSERTFSVHEAYNVRLEELHVISCVFLYNCERPTIAMLYQDAREARHVKTYTIRPEKELGEGPWEHSNVEIGSSMLLAVPSGGVLIIGEQTVTFIDKNVITSTSMPPTLFNAATKVDMDGSRWLLGDHLGNLHLLALVKSKDSEQPTMKLEMLGETSCAAAVAYLDNGIVYVGSEFGDSQLIKLASERNERGSFLTVLESFNNIGPIVDFCIMDVERMGQGQIVTCSGAFKDGSLRVVRSGIGINELATVELGGVQGIWGLKAMSSDVTDKYIVLSFIGETRVLSVTGDELEETEIAGFAGEQSLYCGNTKGDMLLQVTNSAVRLVSCSTLAMLSEWKPPAGVHITVCGANQHQVVVSTGGGRLVYIEIGDGVLKEVSTAVLEHEVACLDVSPLARDGAGGAKYCSVGLWTDISARVLKLPTLEQVFGESLGGEFIPRSTLLVSFEGIDYLMMALGDGHLFTYIIDADTGRLHTKKKVSLGTKPVLLSVFRSGDGDTNHVFAASDRPAVVYSRDKKILYSNVNRSEVSHVCPFNSTSFPNSLATVSEDALTIGTIDDIQKLHIRTIRLNEMPRRIALQESSRTFCLLSVKFAVDTQGDEVETHFVHLLDNQTFEILNSYQLDAYENVCSVVSCSLSADSEGEGGSDGESSGEMYCVGTAYAMPNEPEPKGGRILVFDVRDGKLHLVAEKDCLGAVYTLAGLNGKLLAGINSKVHLFKWQQGEDGSAELSMQCAHYGHTLALYLKVRGDFIVVGDLMKSISLLAYKAGDSALEEIAHDFNPNWMTAVEVLDDDAFLGAENSFNLFTVRRNSEAPTDEERTRLDVVGEYHVGEFVNVIRKGSLVMRHADTESGEGEGDGEEEFSLRNSLIHLFGTVSGMLGVIMSLSKEQYDFLHAVEKALNEQVRGIGGLSHQDWRSFSNERKTSIARNFIDGDLIEVFLDLSAEQQTAVASAVGRSVEYITRAVEELCRQH